MYPHAFQMVYNSFGVYAAITILMLFTFVMLWSPVTILIWHRYGQGYRSIVRMARTVFGVVIKQVSPLHTQNQHAPALHSKPMLSLPPSLRLTQVLGVFQLLLLLCGQTFLQVGVVYTLLPTHRWHVLTRDAYPRCLFCCARAEDKPPENLKELHAEENPDPEVGKSKKRIRTRSGSFRVSLFVRAVLTEPKARRLSMWAEYICSCVQSN